MHLVIDLQLDWHWGQLTIMEGGRGRTWFVTSLEAGERHHA